MLTTFVVLKKNELKKKRFWEGVSLCNHFNALHVYIALYHMACTNLFKQWNSWSVCAFEWVLHPCSCVGMFVCVFACVHMPVGVRLNRGVTKHNWLLICLCDVCEGAVELHKLLVLLHSSVFLCVSLNCGGKESIKLFNSLWVCASVCRATVEPINWINHPVWLQCQMCLLKYFCLAQQFLSFLESWHTYTEPKTPIPS